MIDHTAVNVTDLEAAKAFYSEALEPLGYELFFEFGEFVGFNEPNGGALGVVRRDPVGSAHVAFKCADHATVDAFYEAAMAAGGKDNGSPGLRTLLPRALLRGVRPRRRRQQHRGRLPGPAVTVAHVAVNVSDWERAKRFYVEVLGPLGYRAVYEEQGALAYFADADGLDFGIGRRDPVGGAHVAFDCPDRETVDRSTTRHSRRRRTGQRAAGHPAQYDANYYAAYVLDPDGNNIEAVCHHAPT